MSWLRRFIVAACVAAALIAFSGRVEVGAGAGLAVLVLWWIVTSGPSARMERAEQRALRRAARREARAEGRQ